MDAKKSGCTICNHEHRAEIERKILAGHSNMSIGQEYGFSRMAVFRHKEHMPIMMVQDPAARTGIENHDVFSELDMLKRKLNHIILHEDAATQIKAMSEYRQLLAMTANLTVALERWRHSNISESEEWCGIRAIILEVLAEYPGAKEKFLARLGGINNADIV